MEDKLMTTVTGRSDTDLCFLVRPVQWESSLPVTVAGHVSVVSLVCRHPILLCSGPWSAGQ